MELNFSRKKPDLDEVSEIKSMTEHICQCPMITQFSMIKSFNFFLIEIGFYMEWWGGGIKEWRVTDIEMMGVLATVVNHIQQEAAGRRIHFIHIDHPLF